MRWFRVTPFLPIWKCTVKKRVTLTLNEWLLFFKMHIFNSSEFSVAGFSHHHWNTGLYDWMWGRSKAWTSADGGEGFCVKPALFHEGQRHAHRTHPTSGLQAEWVHWCLHITRKPFKSKFGSHVWFFYLQLIFGGSSKLWRNSGAMIQ